jgi:hypothetical protein
MSESKADQLRAEMLERHRAELAAPGWKGLSNEPERHRARGDMDAWCDWCGDCAEDQPCRCCLAAEVEALRKERDHYKRLWEQEHCPTCFGPCGGCDALEGGNNE